MKINRPLIMVAIAVGLLTFTGLIDFSRPAAAAQAAPATSVITLAQDSQTSKAGVRSEYLTAKLTRDDGRPLSQRTINFYETVDLFGPARVPVGSAVTNAVGVAAVEYETPRAGEHDFIAVYAGDEASTAAYIETVIDFDSQSVLPPLSTPTGMEKITTSVLVVTGVVAVAVWGLLLGVLVGVIRAVSAGSRAQVKW